MPAATDSTVASTDQTLGFMSRFVPCFLLLLGVLVAPVSAQEFRLSDRAESDLTIVQSTLETVRGVLQETLGRVGLGAAEIEWEQDQDDAEHLRTAIGKLKRHVRRMMRKARAAEDDVEAAQLADILDQLDGLTDAVDALGSNATAYDHSARRSKDGYLLPGDFDGASRRHSDADRYDDEEDDRMDEYIERDIAEAIHDDVQRRIRRHDHDYDRDWHTWEGAMVLGDSPLYAESLYRALPAVRYNRVEGLVLGFGVPPLEIGDWDRGHIYGQVGYAFALEDWRYRIGAEVQPGYRGHYNNFGVKLGGAYYRNTATNDLWKIDPLSNALAAFFVEEDYQDYYQIEGWTVYAKQQLGRDNVFGVAYRVDDYESLMRNTSWSLFDGNGFRENPAIDEGRMQSVVFRMRSGHVRDLYGMPYGAALQLEAELGGKDLGGDFDFNRYIADGRIYLRNSHYTGLSLRGRAGYATSTAPFQKTFALGGIGSVRALPQNAFRGHKMFLGNAELAFDDVDLLFSDLQLFVFADAGWVGDTDQTIASGDIMAAAGFGIGLDQRRMRFELAWPVHGPYDSKTPTLLFRLNPTF